jgi:hypothetical protein
MLETNSRVSEQTTLDPDLARRIELGLRPLARANHSTVTPGRSTGNARGMILLGTFSYRSINWASPENAAEASLGCEPHDNFCKDNGYSRRRLIRHQLEQ